MRYSPCRACADHFRIIDVKSVVCRREASDTRSYYPVPEARKSNMRHRPIGIGVQGLADAFMAMRMVHNRPASDTDAAQPFDSPAARQLNLRISETIYYAACEASADLAARDGPYETYEGSPASQGILQYDVRSRPPLAPRTDVAQMWGKTPTDLWDWSALKAKIAKHGLRNSLLVAPMPTASTSQILGSASSRVR